jgi:hypothetical protein
VFHYGQLMVLIISTFRFSFDEEIEEALLGFARLLIYDFEFSRSKKTGEGPAPSLDSKVGKVIDQIISSREADYVGDIKVSSLTL